jgi:AcrR family transcriptional regulator
MKRSGAPPRPTLAEQSRTLKRERVLDAVGDVLADSVWADVKMADVADAAGVSRQTLYNMFGGRRELAQAYVLREAEGFLAAVEEAIAGGGDDPRVALSAALEIFLSAAETHPLVRAISTGEGGDELLALVTARGAPVLGLVGEALAAMLVDNWPELGTGDARTISDFLVRLAISHAALPSGSPSETAATVTRILGPFLDELLAASRAN